MERSHATSPARSTTPANPTEPLNSRGVTTRGVDPRRRSRAAASEGAPGSEPTASGTSDWAQNNRIVCDFFHRGIVRELLPRQRVREWEITEWRPGSRAARASGLSPRSLEAVSSARLVNEVHRPERAQPVSM